MSADTEFRQEDFDRVVQLEGVIAKAILPFAANTPTRLAIFALGRVLKALLRKCDRRTRDVYRLALLESFDAIDPQQPTNPDVAQLTRLFKFH